MMKCVVCLAVLVVVVLADLDVAKNRRRKPLPPPPTPQVLSDTDTATTTLPTPVTSRLHIPPGHAAVSWWEEKVVGKPGAIKEGGFSSVIEQMVVAGVFGRNLLKKFGYVGATTLYDFSPDNPVSAVRVRNPKTCFLIPIRDGVNFENAAATLVARNNSAKTIPRTVVFRDVRGDKQLSADDIIALNGTNRAVVTFCHRLPIYRTKNAKESDIPKDRQFSVLSLDEAVTLAIPQSANADAFSVDRAKLDRVGRLAQATGRVRGKQSAHGQKNAPEKGNNKGRSAQDKGGNTGKRGKDKGYQDTGKGDNKAKNGQDKGE
ncbi:uncharacterized protein [Littorina saxatilis]|uniref:uncharacterized protein n=1 Tax=Littorina saxatilis TaxID=31220 RepID=UPI0038B4BE95